MRALVLLFVGLLIATSAIPADSASRCIVAWELADDTVANFVLDDAATPGAVVRIDAPPLVAARHTSPSAHVTRDPASIPQASPGSCPHCGQRLLHARAPVC